jgi:hypothetical protein
MQDYRSFAVVKPQLIQSIQCLLLDLLLEEALPVDDMFTWYYANTRIGIVTGHSQVHVVIAVSLKLPSTRLETSLLTCGSGSW